MTKLGRYKKLLAALLAGAVVLVASIPLDADPRLVAAGQLVTARAVLCGPANDRPATTRVDLAERVARPDERPRRRPPTTGFP
jgi:hypothetical protein